MNVNGGCSCYMPEQVLSPSNLETVNSECLKYFSGVWVWVCIRVERCQCAVIHETERKRLFLYYAE